MIIDHCPYTLTSNEIKLYEKGFYFPDSDKIKKKLKTHRHGLKFLH